MITYVDTSVLLKLLVEDEVGTDAAERLWLESDFLVCAEIGYAEARAALASARRDKRLDDAELSIAKAELETLWSQINTVEVTSQLVRDAGDLAEEEGLRGYDAVHLAAAIVAHATVVASADTKLVKAAERRGFNVSNPLVDPTPTGDDS